MSQVDHISAIRLRAIPVTGPDALAFMQSQLTIDIESLEESRLYPTAWCNPDGRVDSVMLISVSNGAADLVLPEPLVAPIIKRVRMFSIGRKVTLGDDVVVTPAGPAHSGELRPLALATDPDRCLLLGALDDTEHGSESLPDQWIRDDIDSRLPWLLPETARRYLPQMLGLEALGGLSYRKGCFPGQEIIARVHYRGRVTLRTSRFRLSAESPPAPGEEFEVGGTRAQVLYAVAEPDHAKAVTGLAVVAAETGDEAEIRLGSATGTLF